MTDTIGTHASVLSSTGGGPFEDYQLELLARAIDMARTINAKEREAGQLLKQFILRHEEKNEREGAALRVVHRLIRKRFTVDAPLWKHASYIPPGLKSSDAVKPLSVVSPSPLVPLEKLAEEYLQARLRARDRPCEFPWV